MSILDYRLPQTRRTWRIAAAIAVALSIAGFAAGHYLTQQVIASALSHRDATHTFVVMNKYYVTPGLGLERNVVLLVSSVVFVTSIVMLLHREIRWRFWERPTRNN